MRADGFTLIEVLLSVALLGIVAAVSLPVQRVAMVNTDVSVARDDIVTTLRRAQIRSRATMNSDVWGVNISSGVITLFEGDDFATRDTDEDETIQVPGAVGVAGVTTVVFDQLTGFPQTTGSITVSSSETSFTEVIAIGGNGVIDY